MSNRASEAEGGWRKAGSRQEVVLDRGIPGFAQATPRGPPTTRKGLVEAAGGERPRPGLILLDISMPGLDGFEVLERIKSSPPLKNVPVIMLTSTDHPREIKRSYDLGANAYIVKPVDFERLHEKVRTLGFFLQIIEVAAQ